MEGTTSTTITTTRVVWMPSATWDALVHRATGFTLWNLAGVLLALATRQPDLLATMLCCSVGVCISFHLGWLLDTGGVVRLIRRNSLPEGALFHLYNLLLHVLPVALLATGVAFTPRCAVRPEHGLWSAVLHLGWGLAQTRGSLLLDAIYVDMHPLHWHCMWLAAVVSEVALPLALPTLSRP
jgi:hypothetical protein